METNNTLCQICHKNKATINYADGWMEFTHGFVKKICSDCYDNITKNSEWYKRGCRDTIKRVLKIIDDEAGLFVGFSEANYLKNKISEKRNKIKCKDELKND